jgi:hypothetical protein
MCNLLFWVCFSRWKKILVGDGGIRNEIRSENAESRFQFWGKTVAELLPLNRPFGIAGSESLILSRNFRNANAISDSLLRGLA